MMEPLIWNGMQDKNTCVEEVTMHQMVLHKYIFKEVVNKLSS